MLYRPTDTQGDMLPVSRREQMLTGQQAVLAAVLSRLRLLRGEWWEDDSLGFEVPDFLRRGVRTPQGPTLLTNYITAYIAQTPGVVSVIHAEGAYHSRCLNYRCTIVTDDGAIEGSVNQDVLLPALS